MRVSSFGSFGTGAVSFTVAILSPHSLFTVDGVFRTYARHSRSSFKEKSSMRKLLMVVSTLTLFVCAMYLHWNIDPDAGIMIGVDILFNAGIVFLLGGVVCAIFWRTCAQNPSPTYLYQLLYVGVFCLLPPIGGLFASAWIEGALIQYYRSPAFEHSYRMERGIVHIQPRERNAVFAYCQLIGYETIYELEVTQPQTLIFALEDLDNWSYTFFDLSFHPAHGSTIPTLSSTFSKLDNVYVNWELSQELGLYQVPAGKHVFRLPTDIPSTLTLFDDQPLWTPSGMLAGNVRYPRVYHERLSSEEYEKAVRDAHDQSCQGTQIQGQNPYFLNQHVLLPGYETNQFKEHNNQLYFVDGGNDTYNREHASGIHPHDERTTPPLTHAVLYKEVVNAYTQQPLKIYFMPGTQDDRTMNTPNPNGEVGPCIHARGFDEETFLRELPSKTSFDYHERLHVNCTGAYFFVDQPLKLDDKRVYFNGYYTTANVGKVANLIEVVEPARIYEVSIPVSNSNP